MVGPPCLVGDWWGRPGPGAGRRLLFPSHRKAGTLSRAGPLGRYILPLTVAPACDTSHHLPGAALSGRAVGRGPLQASFAAGARWPGSWADRGAAQQARPRRRTARAVGDPTFSPMGLPLHRAGCRGRRCMGLSFAGLLHITHRYARLIPWLFDCYDAHNGCYMPERHNRPAKSRAYPRRGRQDLGFIGRSNRRQEPGRQGPLLHRAAGAAPGRFAE